VRAFIDAGITTEEVLRWGWLAQAAASAVWDNDTRHALLVRQVRLAREAGALGQLPVMLDALGTAVAARGDLATASALIVEADTICEVTGARAARCTAMLLASLRGRPAEAVPLIEATIAEAAATAARQASEDITAGHVSMWALPELIEAAARGGDIALARDALKQLAEIAQPCGPPIPRSAPKRAAGHCSAMQPTPTTCTAKRSTGWAGPGCSRSWPARICYMASGCAARVGVSMRASNCERPTTCSSRSGWRRSPSARAGS